MFYILLADRGSEFSKYESICKSIYENINRTIILYCDPASLYQKSHIENIHRLLRKYIPKETDISKIS